MGNGDGTFQPSTKYDVASTPMLVGTSDFNDDGKVDVVILDQDAGRLNVVFGNGDGTLQAGREFPQGGRGVISTDFNNDGNADVVVTAPNTSLYLYLGNGDGTLSGSELLPVGSEGALGAADLNGDHNRDLVSGIGSSDIATCIGNGDGTFQNPVSFFAGGSSDFQPGDFNDDGILDLAVPTGKLVNILLGNGDGTFQRPVSQGFGTNAGYVTAGDFNKDGQLDLVSTGVETYILLGNGNGTFKTRRQIGPGGSSLRTGDFNKDGKLDVILLSESGLTVLLGNGDGTFHTGKTFGAGNNTGQWLVRDFNGDGKLDIALLMRNGDIGLILGNGDGTFHRRLTVFGGGASYFTASDVNNDGATDLIVSRAFGNTEGDLVVILNKGGTRVSFVSSSPSVSSKQAVSFTLVVAPSVPGSGIPTGIVSFKDGERIFRTATLHDGVASVTTAALAVGKHTIEASYSGDKRFNPHSGIVLVQDVTP